MFLRCLNFGMQFLSTLACILVFVFVFFDACNKNSVTYTIGASDASWCLVHFVFKHPEKLMSGSTCR